MLSRRQISRELRFEVSIRVKQLRQRRGVSQEELAFAIEMTQASISNYENGRCEIPLSVLIAIRDFLGVSLDELLPNGLATQLADCERLTCGPSSSAELHRPVRPDIAVLTN